MMAFLIIIFFQFNKFKPAKKNGLENVLQTVTKNRSERLSFYES
jgi:hypothetical protein